MNQSPFSSRVTFIAKFSAWLHFAQLIGLAGTVVGMMKSFDHLETGGPETRRN